MVAIENGCSIKVTRNTTLSADKTAEKGRGWNCSEERRKNCVISSAWENCHLEWSKLWTKNKRIRTADQRFCIYFSKISTFR
ncbi:hypothetical protein CDAR_170121 [Caerostris darwini]|uniref:Uncharacterized protein n=1 Tax=Caerostris darwini TaxID=1538125 RepID=A0AAV4RU70_9ARAC|nr:hypothetical protein CDAR_170121 [Caerostris darwini]